MKQWHINHLQDLYDAINFIKNIKLPFRLYLVRSVPKKEHTAEYEKRRKQMAYFHRALCPTYAKLSGLGEDEAKSEFQRRFACVEEHADHFMVESIGGMNNERLAEFIENCTHFLAAEYGEIVDEMLVLNVGKTKTINK